MRKNLVRFFRNDLWRLSDTDLSPMKRTGIAVLKTLWLAGSGFYKNQCHLRATALTLYTLLSVVPVLALAFGIAKGFGFEKLLREQILQQIPEQEAILKEIIVFAQNLLETAKGGVIAGVGVVVLLWSAVNIFGQIEDALNRIWNVEKGRSLGRKFADYLSLMLIYPFVMILSSSITVYLTAQATVLSEKTALLGFVSSLLLFLLRLLPYVILWAFFAFIFIFIPNRKIPFRSGIIAGILAGTLYQVAQWAYISLQVGVTKYNAVYGSFAALPLFLTWLQLSWTLVLFGAEFSFGLQFHSEYFPDLTESRIQPEGFKVSALEVMHLVIRAFKKGSSPLSEEAISRNLGYPMPYVREVIGSLREAGILSEVRLENGGDGSVYQPASDTDGITVSSVLEALEHRGTTLPPSRETPEAIRFREALEAFRTCIRRSPENIKLKEL